MAQTSGGPGGGGPGGGGFGGEGGGREEFRRRMESMSPEEREQMRQRFRERGGGGGGGGAARRTQDGPVTRAIYVVDKELSKPGKPILKRLTIKTGIADNSFTEVLDGLSENDEIVVGVNQPLSAAASQTPQGRSPFGGGFGGRR
jgi:hypothetical protein